MEISDIHAEFEIPYLLELDDSVDGGEDWRFVTQYHSQYAQLRFEKRILDGKPLPLPDFPKADLNGRVCRTLVEVWYSVEFVRMMESLRDDLEFEIDGIRFHGRQPDGFDSYFIGYAMGHLNEFIDLYRILSGRHWVRRLTLESISELDLVETHGDQSDSRTFYMTGDPGAMDQSKYELRTKIKEALSEDVSPSLFQRIRLDIKDNLRKSEYDMAVMNSTRLLEVWVKTAYLALENIKFNNEQSARTDINDRLMDVVEKHLQKHLSYDIVEDETWKRWKNGAYGLRCETIHEGREIDEDDAKSAFNQSKELIAHIATEFEEDISHLSLFPNLNRPND